jgi:putative DNA primase/helicase
VLKLAEHTEKERLTNVEPATSWRGYFLSTSNLSFGQLGQEGGVDIGDAERGRLADIPMPVGGHGLYETLHGFASGEKLSDELQRQSRRVCGAPIRPFIKELVSHRRTDKKALRAFLAGKRQTYLRKLKAESKGLKPLNRISGRYATTFAAGSLAIKYSILPWSRKQLLKAILRCQLDQLRLGDAVDQGAASQGTSLRTKLAQYLNDNHRKFMDLKTKRPTLGSNIEAVPGYIDLINGQTWYYLTSKKLIAIIGRGDNAAKLKRELASEGLLDQQKPTGAQEKGQKKEPKFVVQRRIFVGGKGTKNYRWVHAFSAKLREENKADGTKSVSPEQQ